MVVGLFNIPEMKENMQNSKHLKKLFGSSIEAIPDVLLEVVPILNKLLLCSAIMSMNLCSHALSSIRNQARGSSFLFFTFIVTTFSML